MGKSSRPPILAAGGIVISNGRKPLIAIPQRRRDNAWCSSPKGKLKTNERPIAAARREATEETGCDVRVHEFLGVISYIGGSGPKIAHFWRMQAIGDPIGKLDGRHQSGRMAALVCGNRSAEPVARAVLLKPHRPSRVEAGAEEIAHQTAGAGCAASDGRCRDGGPACRSRHPAAARNAAALERAGPAQAPAGGDRPRRLVGLTVSVHIPFAKPVSTFVLVLRRRGTCST